MVEIAPCHLDFLADANKGTCGRVLITGSLGFRLRGANFTPLTGAQPTWRAHAERNHARETHPSRQVTFRKG